MKVTIYTIVSAVFFHVLFVVNAFATNYAAGWSSITLSNNITGYIATYTLTATNPSAGGSGCVNSCIPSGANITITFPAGTNATTAIVTGSTFGGVAIAAFTVQTATTISFAAPVLIAKGAAFTVVIQSVTNPPAAAYTTLSMTAANITLGTNTFSGGTSTYTIVAAPAVSYTRIAGGAGHSHFVKSDGTACSWGTNGAGQLGDGTTTASLVPVTVSSLTGATTLASGVNFSNAVKNDGTAWSWGWNSYGELGNGTIGGQSNAPVQVSGLTGIIAIEGGDNHALALKNDGTVWSWGYGLDGELGNGFSNTNPNAVQATGLTNVKAISAGGYYSLVLKNDGTVWAWGGNNQGQWGNNGAISGSNVPVRANPLTGIIAISAGGYHSLALKSNGTVWATGLNNDGELGNGTIINSTVHVQVLGPVGVGFLTGIIAIAASSFHSLALKNDGTVWAWGWNGTGALGNGTFLQSSVPVQVLGSGGVGFLTGVIAITATVYSGGSLYQSIAIKNDETVWSWGSGTYGELGNGNTINSNVPVQAAPMCIASLPVGLLAFNATCKDDGVQLEWITSSETNNDYYSVDRSNDATNFETIAIVDGAGNSNTTIHYTVTDENAGSGINYYRLKQTDFDGQHSYSEVITTNCETRATHCIINVISNGNNLNIYISGTEGEAYIINVYDCTGRLVGYKYDKLKEGINEVEIKQNDIAPGIYIVSLSGNGKHVTKKILWGTN